MSLYRMLCLGGALLIVVTAPAGAQTQRSARQVLSVFNDICLATIGDAFASAGEKARELGFRTVSASPFVELHARGYSGGWSQPSVPRAEKYCEIGSSTASRRELAGLIQQRLRENSGREPRRARHPDPQSLAWWISSEGRRLYYTVTVGMNDDPATGATARITFDLPGN
ncbi:hypothetical protein [Phreatobacter sp.]|uniref:hypothetical protein n=1 Tax=Phreatobacter sp. TaxID=1966341 RepID=UPI003F72EC25